MQDPQNPQSPEVASIATTVATAEDARRLARSLVERRLAACVQIDAGLTSVYRWDGKLCEEPELRLTIKTTPDRVAEVEHVVRTEHPYQLPQFIVSVMRPSEAYGRWVKGETGG
jgi:periplasmic divalent cation tolerance protein